jgi:hypothetical protein
LIHATVSCRPFSGSVWASIRCLTRSNSGIRSALEVYTKADLPQGWAATQNNLGAALWELGTRSGGEEGTQQLCHQPPFCNRSTLPKTQHQSLNTGSNAGDAVQRSDRDNLTFIQGNLAHALLFQGHYDEALAIYRQYWNKPLHEKTFGEITLEDFAAFDKAGLTHPDLSRMKQALSDLTSKSPSPR